ncbi:MAG: hypothetical protein JSS86_22200 [Cyanobacteria bacterium SZAS LIN-2]|nr:hypothetical protein [Cyanobacteria bacterium SZAS LIN-2]
MVDMNRRSMISVFCASLLAAAVINLPAIAQGEVEPYSLTAISQAEQKLQNLNKQISQPGEHLLLIARRVYQRLKVGDFDGALEDEVAAAKRLSEHGNLLGTIYQNLSNMEAARKCYSQEADYWRSQKKYDSNIYEYWPSLNLALNKFDSVITDVGLLLKGGFRSEYASYLSTQAFAYYRLAKFDSALECVNKANGLEPYKDIRPQSACVKALVLRDKGDLDGALRAVNCMINLRPKRSTDNYIFIDEAAILPLRASIYALRNRPDQALADLRFAKKLSALQSNGESAYLMVARNLRKAGNLKASQQVVKEAISDLDSQKKALLLLEK